MKSHVLKTSRPWDPMRAMETGCSGNGPKGRHRTLGLVADPRCFHGIHMGHLREKPWGSSYRSFFCPSTAGDEDPTFSLCSCEKQNQIPRF